MGGPLIALLTDFGLQDTYVGEMKGVLLSLAPDARLVDLTHEVAPQDVLEGAFHLGRAVPAFPPGTLFLAVVDPGVGTGRPAVAVEGPGWRFVGPDNGLLTFLLRETPVWEGVGEGPFGEPVRVPVPAGWRAHLLTRPDLWRHPVSATFHGRDVFAPVGARLARGLPMDQVGAPVDSLTALRVPHPRREGDGWVGHILHADRFGNLITTLPGRGLEPGRWTVEAGGHVLPLVRTYGDASGPCALVGSHGQVEIAVPGESARDRLGLHRGEAVRARPL